MIKLPFSIFDSNELYATVNYIVEACRLTFGDNEYLMKLCDLLNVANQNLRNGLGRTFNGEFTSILLHADEERDNAFFGLRDYVQACCNQGDVAKEVAANKIYEIIEAVGDNLHRLHYTTESTKLDLLFEKLDTAIAREALTTIVATEWLTRLKVRQTDFEKINQSKVEAETGINLPLMKNSKDLINSYLSGLVAYSVTSNNFDAAHFGGIEEKIRGIITDAVTLAHNRATRKENAEMEAAKITP